MNITKNSIIIKLITVVLLGQFLMLSGPTIGLINAAIPTAPPPPSMPEGPGDPPSAPEAPETPTAPESPSVPESPSTESNPTPPSQPTAPENPTAPSNPSNDPQPTSAPSPTVTQAPVANNNQPVANETTSSDNTSTASNQQTGADSENNSTTNTNDQTEVNSNNDAEVDNQVVAVSSSGNNHGDKNTGNSNVESGDATVNGNIGTTANNNTTVVDTSDCDECIISPSNGEASNQQTGADSSNNSDVDINSDVIINNNNSADLNTGVIAIADSGHNTANKNTGNGEVVTGDANVGLTVVNTANTNISGVSASEFDIYDDHNGDIVINFEDAESESATGSAQASNQQTGANSSNNSEVDDNTSLTIVNQNDAKVANELVLNATSGHNQANKNTGNGEVKTGDANVAVNVVNLVNNNIQAGAEMMIATVNIFGNLVGDIILAPIAGCTDNCSDSNEVAANQQTGANSENDASVGMQRLTELNQHNQADINNNLVINANTGGNSTEKNTGSTDVQTGEVNVQAEQVNIANTNMIGNGDDTWWIVIVNEAGQWVGKIFGMENGEHVAQGSVELGAVNQNTGADSNNQSDINQSQETYVTQENTAEVDNNIVINADTGHNQVDKNTGNASVQTGDVNVMSNVVNYVNNNIAGGKVMVAFVNVFGSWVGDVLPPGWTGADGDQTNEQPENENNQSEEQPLAIGGPESVPNLNNETDSSTENSNTESQNSENNEDNSYWYYDNQVAYAGISSQTNSGNKYNNQVLGDQNMSPRERVLAGIWLREEDPYLQTTPTPGSEVQSMLISSTKNGFNQNEWKLLMWLSLGLPFGVLAWRLKKYLQPTTSVNLHTGVNI